MKLRYSSNWFAGLIALALSMVFVSSVFAETSVTDKVELVKGRLMYDRLTGTSYFDVSIRNISQDTLLAPIKVVIDSISASTVTVNNMDGYTDDRKPFFDYSSLIGSDNILSPGEVSNARKWMLKNTDALRFTYSTTVYGDLPPETTPISITVTNPVANSVISNSAPYITIVFGEEISDATVYSLTIEIDAVDETENFDINYNRAMYQLPYSLAPGNHEISVALSDNNGNENQVVANFTVLPSNNPNLYLFSLKDNAWIFASPGDGTYNEYMNQEDAGIYDNSDLASLSMPSIHNEIFFSFLNQGGVYLTSGAGSYSLYLSNTQLGLSDAARLNALSLGLAGDPIFFSSLGYPGIYQSAGTGSYQAYLDNTQLGISLDASIDSLDKGLDDSLYFHIEGQDGIYKNLDGANTLFLTEDDLGVPGSILDAFTLLVAVHEPPVARITASPAAILAGESATLSWNVTNADTVTIDQGIGAVSLSGAVAVTPDQTTTYTITAQGPGGTTTASAIVTVTPAQDPPVIAAFTAASGETPILQGASTTLSWQCANAADVTTVHINPVGTVAMDAGPLAVTPDVTTTYTLMVSNQWGTASAQVTVLVTVPHAPLKEGSFGEQYEDLIPADSTVAEYNVDHFSVATGLVYDVANNPLSGVAVTVLEHPRYGTSVTDSQGRFTMPVDVGGVNTLVYRKNGYLEVHRQINITWNDITPADNVVMIHQDPAATTITLDGDPQSTFTHVSSESNDADGKRASSLVFKGDTVAYAVDAKGNTIQTLPNTLTVRATEYTVGDNGRAAMPAKLPPQSAYTYCVDLRVDGVERVRFSKPVTLWVDNFLGFPVGGRVPVGYYDRDRGVWVPQPNGVVARFMDTNGDGTADAIDATGNGQPTDLNNDASFADEIAGLDVTTYQPGTTIWRVEVQHFSPWDCNWPFRFPADAIMPNSGEPSVDAGKQDGKDCNTQAGSYMNDRSRVLHQDIPIPGIDIALHYSSERTEGFKYTIAVPVSGPEVPSSLTQIIARVTVGGKTFEQIFAAPPLANKVAEFQWDGLDCLNRRETSMLIHVEVGFVYDLHYATPAERNTSFGLAPPLRDSSASVRVRNGGGLAVPLEGIQWKIYNLTSLMPNSEYIRSNALLAEGWTITNHHHVVVPTLFRGDGTSKNGLEDIISTVAGNGRNYYSGDGGPAVEAQINRITGIAADAAGNIYLSIWDHVERIRKIDAKGIITTIAGNGTTGYGGDGGPAVDAQLNLPRGIALDAAGNIYLADSQNHRIRKIDANGIITTIAGKGSMPNNTQGGGYSGDGGPAVDAYLTDPHGIAVDTAGNIYVADYGNNRIRKIDANGIITTIAGGGYDTGGDGGLAVDAQLRCVSGIAVDTAGNIYLSSDWLEHRIRKIDVNGIITTIAGDGIGGYYSGDGGPAVDVALSPIPCIDVDTAGNLYLSDNWNNRIMKIDVNGIITTIAGNGTLGYGGDGGLAVDAQLNRPFDLAIDAAGNFYIADMENYRIRKVDIKRGKINTVTDENGQGYIMDQTGRHTKTIDLATGATIYEFEYDTYGDDRKLARIKDRFNRYTTFERDGSGTPTAIVSPDGIITQLTVGEDNHLTNVVYPDNSGYAFTYTGDGLMRTKIEPEGNNFEYLYDTAGKLTDVYDHQNGEPFGHWMLYRHAIQEGDPELSEGFSAGDVLYRVTTGERNMTTYIDSTSYRGYNSEITGPAGDKTHYFSTNDDLHVEKSLSCGKDLIIDYSLDSEYLAKYVSKLVEKFPSGLTREMTGNRVYEETNSSHAGYDRITEQTVVNGKTTGLITDVVSNQKTVTSPMNRTVTSHYDPVSLLPTDLQAPGQHLITYSYDNKGRPTKVSAGDRIVNMEYDDSTLSDRTVKVTVTDTDNVIYLITVYHYDIMDRLWKVEQKDKDDESVIVRTTSYTYDENGNMHVLAKQDQAGDEVEHIFTFNEVNLASLYTTPTSGNYQYIYNKDRALVRVISPSGTRNIQNIYTNSLLSQIQTAEGAIDLTYECSSKVHSMTRGDDAEQTTLTYGYDGTLLTSVQTGGILAQTIGYAYNNDFKLGSMSYAGGAVSLGYDMDGLLTSAGLFTISRDAQTGHANAVAGGALNMGYAYNQYGQFQGQSVAVNGTAGYAWDLDHDNADRVETRTDTFGAVATSYAYTYDDLGRLNAVQENGVETERYTYYPNGARATEINIHKGIVTPRTYQYNSEDQLTNAGDIEFSHDADGFLSTKSAGGNTTSYTYSSLGELTEVALPDGNIINYIYDPLGRRVVRMYNGTVTDKYLWQGQTRLLAVYDGNDNLLMRFEYAAGRMPVAMNRAGATFYLACDQVGSLRLVTDASGNTVKRIDYDAFGAVYNDTNPGFSVPFGFAGGLYDADTGLVRFGFRDYDPDTGRWTAKDPILFAGGDTDLYGYCMNNPINFIDPEGRFWVVVGVVITDLFIHIVIDEVVAQIEYCHNRQEQCELTNIKVRWDGTYLCEYWCESDDEMFWEISSECKNQISRPEVY